MFVATFSTSSWKWRASKFYCGQLWLHCNQSTCLKRSVRWKSRSVNCHMCDSYVYTVYMGQLVLWNSTW